MASDSDVSIKIHTKKVRKPKGPVRIETPCPSCGHRTLFIGSGGHLTCAWMQCREPGVEHRVDQLRATEKKHEHVMRRLNGQRFYLASVLNMRKIHKDALGTTGELKLLDTATAATVEVLAQLTDEPGQQIRGILLETETAPGVEPDAGVQIRDIGNLPPVAGTRTVTITRG